MRALTLLVVCIDGGSWDWFGHHGGEATFPMIGRTASHRASLPSTVVPQTPVAWTAFLAGAEPAMTGIWGWHTATPAVRPVDHRDLPNAVYLWEDKVLLAGLPFLRDERRGPVRMLPGVGGPTKTPGGSRPSIPQGVAFDAQVEIWRRHHVEWAGTVVQASLEHDPELAVVHCDAVDWFSHRYGPGTTRGGEGWRLADDLVAMLRAGLSPAATLLVSDHGSAEVTCFVRVHDALVRAGLASMPAEAATELADFAEQPVRCVSDYGALWCSDKSLIPRAAEMLRDLGAEQVVALSGRHAPDLVPRFPDGWVVLLPPVLDPGGDALHIRSGPEFKRLRSLNWLGDHGHVGLVGCDDPELWAGVRGVNLAELKGAMCRYTRSRIAKCN